jgi:hypothetical protein
MRFFLLLVCVLLCTACSSHRTPFSQDITHGKGGADQAANQERKRQDPPLPKPPPGCVASCSAEAHRDWQKCRADAIARGGNEAQCDELQKLQFNECVNDRCGP